VRFACFTHRLGGAALPFAFSILRGTLLRLTAAFFCRLLARLLFLDTCADWLRPRWLLALTTLGFGPSQICARCASSASRFWASICSC
jgi:hypothetical protein